uniref:Ferredoxin--nitrite reductase n=1 Tax=Ascaris lumbricoides TaxID=6252 RepID=A0A0M3IAR8_ASCLU
MPDNAKEEMKFANQHSSEQVEQISNYWNIELLGIRDSPTEHEDQQAMDIFKETVKRTDGGYSVSLPFRDSVP